MEKKIKKSIRGQKYKFAPRFRFPIHGSTVGCSVLQDSFLRLYILVYEHKTKGERKMTQSQVIATADKFQSAEQLWFWFLYSRTVRNNNFLQNRATPTRRPCEVLDVETLITKLYLAGKLNDEQLAVMKTWGDKRRAPHQYIWNENRAARQWDTAMQVIDAAARARGWIE